MDAIESALRGRAPVTAAEPEAFWRQHVSDARSFERPIDRAIVGGASTDLVGFAFVAGYAAALQALVPGLPRETLASLAATEAAGAHPRTIETRLEATRDGRQLTGHKSWVTLAGERLFVFAREGTDPDGRARTVLVGIERNRPGVEIVPLAPLPFVPEVAHAEVRLEAVHVREEDLLPGDGWQDWVKPFRTVEDLHVHAALLGMLLSLGARVGWPRPLREQMAATLVSLRALAVEPPASPAVHLALAGTLEQTRAIVEALEPHWSLVSGEVRERWLRDRPLLGVASKARAARRERAWERLVG